MMEIPKDVEIEVNGSSIVVKGKNGKIERSFSGRGLKIERKGDKIEVTGGDGGNMLARTVEAHIKNMFRGVTEGFSRKLQVVHSHFPISVEVKGDKVFIKNFIGEKRPRVAKIVKDTKVEVKGVEVFVSGPDKEAVGQTAANIYSATKIRGKDCRVFQDGIYLIE
ncbi:MAG: LSU ribosomal protein L9e (L6p) [Candidatus Fermentimicrarchaeum limneticum]|uniref:50S ribosomal protein L6 n=1 Tax=Fermentimicrarchaeum limneticum TaxID=2795018 RepID=A0A7D5XLY8_FERL1|nr:MAG: LSU ribosomal protein L9e (L6p) [Candidatus Fermentimicrarchaeum limneticum]